MDGLTGIVKSTLEVILVLKGGRTMIHLRWRRIKKVSKLINGDLRLDFESL